MKSLILIVCGLFVFIILYCCYCRVKTHLGNFIPTHIYKGKYEDHKIRKGFEIMKHKTIAFCGLARDIKGSFKMMRRKYEYLGSFFKDYVIIIVENDSTDGTRGLLNKWRMENNRVIILGCGFNKDECKMGTRKFNSFNAGEERIGKMAMLRNIYMNLINHITFDYTAIVDYDILGSIYIDGIAHTIYNLETYKDIDAIGANSINTFINAYYDSFAFIKDGDNIDFKNYFEKGKHDFDVYKTIDYRLGQPLKKVRSCFGGFVIYKTSKIKNRKYSSAPKGKIGCEHVYFNDGLRMYINPSMIFSIFFN